MPQKAYVIPLVEVFLRDVPVGRDCIHYLRPGSPLFVEEILGQQSLGSPAGTIVE